MAVESQGGGEESGSFGILGGKCSIVEEQQDLFYFVAPQTSQGVLHALCPVLSPQRAAALLCWTFMIIFACKFEDSELIITPSFGLF